MKIGLRVMFERPSLLSQGVQFRSVNDSSPHYIILNIKIDSSWTTWIMDHLYISRSTTLYLLCVNYQQKCLFLKYWTNIVGVMASTNQIVKNIDIDMPFINQSLLVLWESCLMRTEHSFYSLYSAQNKSFPDTFCNVCFILVPFQPNFWETSIKIQSSLSKSIN